MAEGADRKQLPRPALPPPAANLAPDAGERETQAPASAASCDDHFSPRAQLRPRGRSSGEAAWLRGREQLVTLRAPEGGRWFRVDPRSEEYRECLEDGWLR